MADTVTTEYIYDGQRRKLLHATAVSDGTGESGVAKVDLSAITFGEDAATPTYSTVDWISYNIQGYDSIRLYFDHDTDDELAILPAGSGEMDWTAYGGKTDPQTTGGTGDIILTTNGHVSGATYDITIALRPKA